MTRCTSHRHNVAWKSRVNASVLCLAHAGTQPSWRIPRQSLERLMGWHKAIAVANNKGKLWTHSGGSPQIISSVASLRFTYVRRSSTHLQWLMVPSFTFIDRTEPVSPTRRTTTSGPRLRPDVRHSASELHKFGEAIYRQVWDEFYRWEPGYASDILGDIKNNPVVRVRGGARKMAKSMAKRFSERTSCPVVASGGSATSSVVITEYATDSGARTTTVVPVPTVVLSDAKRLPPHPPYECCPPINRSILINETEASTAKFLPYAEDSSFPVESYLKKFEHLEWAQEFDPDCKHRTIPPPRNVS